MSDSLENPICLVCLGYMLDMDIPKKWKKCVTCGYCKDFSEGKIMITMDEILKGRAKFSELSKDIQDNLTLLLNKANEFRNLWGKPVIITSGLRTMVDHLKIYSDKGITDPSKIPMKSKHLYGQAIDIADPKLEITAWFKANPAIQDQLNIYFEEGNTNWVHMQIVPFGSYKQGGTRWFKP